MPKRHLTERMKTEMGIDIGLGKTTEEGLTLADKLFDRLGTGGIQPWYDRLTIAPPIAHANFTATVGGCTAVVI